MLRFCVNGTATTTFPEVIYIFVRKEALNQAPTIRAQRSSLLFDLGIVLLCSVRGSARSFQSNPFACPLDQVAAVFVSAKSDKKVAIVLFSVELYCDTPTSCHDNVGWLPARARNHRVLFDDAQCEEHIEQTVSSLQPLLPAAFVRTYVTSVVISRSRQLLFDRRDQTTITVAIRKIATARRTTFRASVIIIAVTYVPPDDVCSLISVHLTYCQLGSSFSRQMLP
uniref:Secreted protein n=1 Tax=Steinernema glaseri TaxID=37863 RepID=A0A1I8AC07_9BILA